MDIQVNENRAVNNPQVLRANIQARLKALGISATAAADRAGLNKGAVRDILAGKIDNPRVDNIIALAAALKCSVYYLLGMSDDPTDSATIRRANDPAIPVEGISHVGVFRSRIGDFTHLHEHDTIVAPRHPRFTTARHFAVIVGDEMMAAAKPRSIRAGDYALCVDWSDTQTDPQDSRIYFLKKNLPGSDLFETSLRVCHAKIDRYEFVTAGVAEQAEPIIAPKASPDSIKRAQILGIVYATFYPYNVY